MKNSFQSAEIKGKMSVSNEKVAWPLLGIIPSSLVLELHFKATTGGVSGMLVNRSATQKFRFNKPANSMDNLNKKLIIWVLTMYNLAVSQAYLDTIG